MGRRQNHKPKRITGVRELPVPSSLWVSMFFYIIGSIQTLRADTCCFQSVKHLFQWVDDFSTLIPPLLCNYEQVKSTGKAYLSDSLGLICGVWGKRSSLPMLVAKMREWMATFSLLIGKAYIQARKTNIEAIEMREFPRECAFEAVSPNPDFLFLDSCLEHMRKLGTPPQV